MNKSLQYNANTWQLHDPADGGDIGSCLNLLVQVHVVVIAGTRSYMLTGTVR